MMVNVQASSATTSVAVSRAVQNALGQVPQALQLTEKVPEASGVQAAVDEAAQGTAQAANNQLWGVE